MSPAQEKRSAERATAGAWRPACLLGLLLYLSIPAIAATQESSGRIVLDIPIRQSLSPEDSKEQVTLAVRGMKKSRSGAT